MATGNFLNVGSQSPYRVNMFVTFNLDDDKKNILIESQSPYRVNMFVTKQKKDDYETKS